MNACYSETPEAVAWELTVAISEAEGRPIRRRGDRQQQSDRGMNQTPRSYILDLYAACLTVARGDRDFGSNAWRH